MQNLFIKATRVTAMWNLLSQFIWLKVSVLNVSKTLQVVVVF